MKNKKRVLGRGLAALLKNPKTDITSNKTNGQNTLVDSISEVLITNIKTNPFQPRNEFKVDKLEELKKSIEKLGIIQPLTVRKLGYDKYELISGERRLKAAKLLGLKKVPAFIRIADDQEMLEMALVENIQREELNPIEIALSYKRLIEECKLTQDKMSQRVGKKRSTISNYLRLLKLPAQIQLGLKEKLISTGHARAIINIENKETQLNIYEDTILHGFSVRVLEQIVKDFSKIGYKKISRNKDKKSSFKNIKLTKKINEIMMLLDTEIKLNINKSGKGKLELFFSDEKHLEQLLKYFNK